ncbi:MAG: DeoR/GlpR transcriptional regulator [Lachnospiraceae bacterium]|nr:DeoR/GlpR transcriptional regulator [Lachnospiraceae bacterium]
MPFYEREDKIINILLQKEVMTVNELAEKLYISKPTLRRDLLKLEQKGIIARTHGAASLIKNPADTKISFNMREQEQNNAKTIMAQRAVSFIKDGDIIMLDATTSAYHIIPFLADFHNIIVITSSAKTSLALGQLGIRNFCTGGLMIPKSFSYVGGDAQDMVSRYNADVLFFSCRGLSEDGYLSDNSIEENLLRTTMMRHAKKKILLCDSSKIGKVSLHNLCHISEVDEIICETKVPQTILDSQKKD